MQRGRFSFRPYDDARKLRQPEPRRVPVGGKSLADYAQPLTADHCRFCARNLMTHPHDPGCPRKDWLDFKPGQCWLLHGKHFLVRRVDADDTDEMLDTIVGLHDWSALRSYWVRRQLMLLVDRPTRLHGCNCQEGIGA